MSNKIKRGAKQIYTAGNLVKGNYYLRPFNNLIVKAVSRTHGIIYPDGTDEIVLTNYYFDITDRIKDEISAKGELQS